MKDKNIYLAQSIATIFDLNNVSIDDKHLKFICEKIVKKAESRNIRFEKVESLMERMLDGNEGQPPLRPFNFLVFFNEKMENINPKMSL